LEGDLRLERLEQMVTDARHRTEGGLQIGLEHAYFHLNVAWHARRVPMSRYASMTGGDFNKWGRFPKDVELPRLEVRRATTRR
jgi:hypothetical protein